MAIIIMPKQGLQMTEGVVTRWLKKEGETVAEGEPLFEMETDKLTITIDSSASGVLSRILRAEGDTVPVAEPIAVIGEGGDSIMPQEKPATSTVPEMAPASLGNLSQSATAAPAEKPTPSSAPKPTPSSAPKSTPSSAPKPPADSTQRFATPRARMRAEERGLDWKAIIGTGPDGLVIERDVCACRQGEKPVCAALAFQAVQVNMAEAKQLFEQFAAHEFSFGVIDLLERATARAGELLNVNLTAGVSKADLSVASSQDILTLGETGPSGMAWLTLTSAGETDKSVQALRWIQMFLEHPLLLL